MNYFEMINRVIQDIEVNLEEEINLESFSKKYYFSKFHLYRIFRAVTGYTLTEYIDKRRLSKSLILLNDSTHTILDISIACGMNSHEVFTRKFKKAFNLTPSQYRKGDHTVKSLEAIKVLKRDFINKNSDIIATYTQEHLSDLTLYGKTCNNGYDDANDPDTVGNFLFGYADECFENFPHGHLFLATMSIDQSSGDIQYFVGFDQQLIDKDYDSLRVESSNYAVFNYTGVFRDHIKAILNDIYKSISLSDLEIRDIGVEFLEVYDQTYLDTLNFKIYVPIID